NTAGYKMDFFTGMSYAEICPIFQARFDSVQVKRGNGGRRSIAQEAKDLKKRLEVLDNEGDYVFIEATPLARKPLELMLSKRSRKNTKCVNAAYEELTAAKHKLMLLVYYC
nr:hypothetical protein [Tanacetum cinerariifolium]